MSDIVERLREWTRIAVCAEAAAEIERLRAIEEASKRAFYYHTLGYVADSGFDADRQIALLDKLGVALGEKG